MASPEPTNVRKETVLISVPFVGTVPLFAIFSGTLIVEPIRVARPARITMLITGSGRASGDGAPSLQGQPCSGPVMSDE